MISIINYYKEHLMNKVLSIILSTTALSCTLLAISSAEMAKQYEQIVSSSKSAITATKQALKAQNSNKIKAADALLSKAENALVDFHTNLTAKKQEIKAKGMYEQMDTTLNKLLDEIMELQLETTQEAFSTHSF